MRRPPEEDESFFLVRMLVVHPERAKRIEECRHRFIEPDTVFPKILGRFRFVPLELHVDILGLS